MTNLQKYRTAVLAAAVTLILPSSTMAWAPQGIALAKQPIVAKATQQPLLRTLTAGTLTRAATALPLANDDADEVAPEKNDDSTTNPLQDALNKEGAEMFQQARAPPPPPPPPRRLDPLIASLTRMDDATRNAPTVKAPIFGEIPLDGSLVVLIPTALIGIAGFVMSIYIALHAQDAIVASLNEFNQEITSAVSKPIISPDDGGCRGLCSSQEQDLEGMRVFLENLSGRNK